VTFKGRPPVDRSLKDLMEDERRAEVALREAQGKLANVRYQLKQELAKKTGVDPYDLELGGWDCPDSITGYCYYDSAKDSALDFCLVCGGPDERK